LIWPYITDRRWDLHYVLFDIPVSGLSFASPDDQQYLFLLSLFRLNEISSRFAIPLTICVLFILFLFGPQLKSRFSLKKEAFVITIAGEDVRLPAILKLFHDYAHIHLRPFYGFHGNREFAAKHKHGLTSGQRGLRQTMKMFFNMTLRESYDQVMVFQDDAIPHLHFSTLLAKLPQRCRDADLLLLGASMWHKKRSRWPNETCFDADGATYGAYGLSVKRKAFRPILDWLDRLEHITFDHIYPYLQSDGVVVRVAHPPFLVIMDVSHKSLINNHRASIQFDVAKRAKIHGWNLTEYPTVTLLPSIKK
jgi:hypothetical protein